jgi:hypothetical protein
MKNKLLYRKSLGRLACALCMMVLSTQLSWGQDQVIGAFPYMQGGFENQTAGTITSAANGSANVWTRSAAGSTSSIVSNATLARSGAKYAIGNVTTGGSNRGLQSPTGTPPTAASHVVQFYYRNHTGATLQSGLFGTNGAIQNTGINATATWVKVNVVMTSGTTANYAYVGRANPTPAFTYDVDDVVVYAGSAVDDALPDNPTTAIASAVGDNQQTISWTAAPIDAGNGVDGGGYMVVRGTAAIASTPNPNGIYGVNNEVVAGEKVVYVGTAVSFVDTGLLPANTYYYKIYSVDKAFNYGDTPITVNSTTTGSITPVITASTTTLSGFLATNASASTSQSFSVTGLNLTNDLVVSTVSTDYELSTDDFATAGVTSINLGAGPTVSSTPIYVRLKSGLLGGTKTANLSVASTGAAALPDVVCTGGVSATYYYVGTGALTTSTNWGINTDGSGTQPTAVTDSYATFVLRNTTALSTDASWVLGTSSKLVVGDATQSAVALTVTSTFPITGTIDITAASSGANSLIWQDIASPTFSTLHPSSELYLRPTATATYFFTPTPTFGKLIIDGINTVGIGNTFSIATSLNVASNSVLNLAFGGTTFSTLGAGATATINGKITTSKGSNGEMFTFNNLGNGALRFFDPITTPSILTLGPDSTVELSNSATGASGTQTVSVLPVGVTYANLILTSTASPNTKNIFSAVTVTNKLTINLFTGATLNLGAGLLTLKSTATKTAVVAPLTTSPTITGTLVAERYIPAGNRAYRLLSPATTGGTIQANWQEGQADGVDLNVGFGTHITGAGGAANGFDTTTSNAASLFTHNNTGAPATWTAAANTNVNTLTAGSPYLIYLRGSRLATNINGSLTNDATTLRTTGALATGTQVVSGLNTTADGFSLIGNPYQAQVDMQAVLLASTDLVQGFYYVVDPSLGSKGAYYTVDVTAASTADYSKYLQPGQACFVKTVAAPTAPALSFLEANKSETDAQTSIFRTKNTVMSNIDLTLLDGASNRLDVLKVAFDASETNDVNQNDATKLTNFDENMATSNSSKLLAIEKRAIPTATDEIPLNITKYRGTSYKIKATGTGLTGETPYLVDAFANTITEIPQDGTVEYVYTVDTATPASIAADRFKITYTNKTLKTIDNASEGFALYPNPSKSNSFNVVVPQGMNKASLTVSNLLGQKLYSQNDLQSGATARVNVSNVKTAGVYLVSLTSEGKTATTKWIVE